MDSNQTFAYVPDEWSWHDKAACNNAPEKDAIAMVSPPTGGSSPIRARELITAYCDHCPVVAQCRNWAQGEEAFVGVAGGRRWSQAQRSEQIAARQAAKHNRAVEAAERAGSDGS